VRIWNTRRDQGYFYVEAVLPDPATSELEREVEALLSSYQLDPPLSSVHTPRFEIGQAAARALLLALQSGLAAADERLPWTLIARAST
jgi:hypothetical protein